MSLLKGLANSAVTATERDTLGGATLFESDVYEMTVDMLYLQKSKEANGKGGALGAFLTLKTDDGKQLRQTIYITSGIDKGSKATYTNKENVEEYLPGYLLINSLALLGIGEELSALEEEEKVVKIYNFEAKAEVPTKVPVLTQLLGTKIKVAVIKQTVDKNVKDDNGNYVPSGETRDENEIVKFFRAEDNMTTAEVIAGAEEATFINDWLAKNKGKTIVKAGKGKAAAGTAGAPKAAAPAAKPKSSLFGKKPEA